MRRICNNVFPKAGHIGCHDASERVGELRSTRGKFSFNILGVERAGKLPLEQISPLIMNRLRCQGLR